VKKSERLRIAKMWLETADTRDIILDYSRKFRVDRATAARELQFLGYPLSQETVDSAVRLEEKRREWLQVKRDMKREFLVSGDEGES